MDSSSNAGKRKSLPTEAAAKRTKMVTNYENYGEDSQRFLICKWVLDHVGRFGWGSTPVSSENKKKAWLELWEYANQVVGLAFPSVDRIMKFIKTIRQSIFEKMKSGGKELNEYEKILFEAMTNPERVPEEEPEQQATHGGMSSLNLSPFLGYSDDGSYLLSLELN